MMITFLVDLNPIRDFTRMTDYILDPNSKMLRDEDIDLLKAKFNSIGENEEFSGLAIRKDVKFFGTAILKVYESFPDIQIVFNLNASKAQLDNLSDGISELIDTEAKITTKQTLNFHVCKTVFKEQSKIFVFSNERGFLSPTLWQEFNAENADLIRQFRFQAIVTNFHQILDKVRVLIKNTSKLESNIQGGKGSLKAVSDEGMPPSQINTHFGEENKSMGEETLTQFATESQATMYSEVVLPFNVFDKCVQSLIPKIEANYK